MLQRHLRAWFRCQETLLPRGRRTAITYATPIWCDAAKLCVSKASLRSTQRKFCIDAIWGFRTVPTLTAIAILCVPPLNLKVLLLSSFLRPPTLSPSPPNPPSPFSFPLSSQTSLSLYSPPPLLTSTTTPMAPSPAAVSGPASPGSLLLPSPLAECFGFRTALSDLPSLPPPSPPPSPLTCQTLLYSLLPSRNLTLHWVKGHSGNPGNCQADTLAKGATEDKFISARPSFFLKLGLTPSSLTSSHSFLLPRTAIATGLLTGHSFIAAFPHKKTPPPFDPTCPQAPKTIDHIFFYCPNLDSLCATFFHKCLTDLGLIPTYFPQLFSSGKVWALALDFATQSNRFVPSNIPQSSSDSDTST
ncbi:hypothetical protein LAZ67_X001215 [Cordylochernes scorpioides]|uniref:RNase H type-1 domain-containing protein n=1 Tax=Cordylochernes scorpioides TaxID=51811 RepID=A0ABY6LSP9_9ARAC|nr:hypothetical protein LAZ67_X001215 [Cordylochernes scorpioides]